MSKTRPPLGFQDSTASWASSEFSRRPPPFVARLLIYAICLILALALVGFLLIKKPSGKSQAGSEAGQLR